MNALSVINVSVIPQREVNLLIQFKKVSARKSVTTSRWTACSLRSKTKNTKVALFDHVIFSNSFFNVDGANQNQHPSWKMQVVPEP